MIKHLVKPQTKTSTGHSIQVYVMPHPCCTNYYSSTRRAVHAWAASGNVGTGSEKSANMTRNSLIVPEGNLEAAFLEAQSPHL
jgi:hypothetical protein